MAFVLLAVLAGCGGTTYGGNGFNVKPGAQSKLTDPTPTPAASQTTASQPTVAPTHSAPAPPPTHQAQTFQIGINADTSNRPQFDPPAAKVYTGTIIHFTNHDSVTRSVVSDSNAFNSGPLPPGGGWNYTASTPGTFNYHDGTRPYAVAYFQVVNP